MFNSIKEKMLKSIEDNFGFIVIVLFLFIISLYEFSLGHSLSLVRWILLLGTIGLLYQLIFPKIPLRVGRILAYALAIVLFLITLVFISNENFVERIIVKLESKITTKETIENINILFNFKCNKVEETNGSK